MSTLNDLHGKVPAPPVHVAALGFNGPYEIMTMSVRLATCRDRNVADYIAALWNLMPQIAEPPTLTIEGVPIRMDNYVAPARIVPAPDKTRRRKAGKSVQVVP